MQENFIIHLVQTDNEGNSLHKVNTEFKEDLLKIFGGFTAHKAEGAWLGNDGKVYSDSIERVIVSAAPEKLSLHGKLALLTMYAKDAKQKCVYAVIDGEVYFVEPVTFTALYDINNSHDSPITINSNN